MILVSSITLKMMLSIYLFICVICMKSQPTSRTPCIKLLLWSGIIFIALLIYPCLIISKRPSLVFVFLYHHPPPVLATSVVGIIVWRQGAKVLLNKPTDTSTPHSLDGKWQIQEVVDVLLYHTRALNSSVLVALSDIGSTPANPTKHTM